ncbi:hypothetical protein BT96DRAFT_357444 [Gymnopus androsaceus JB14]|uniref:Uncharacterized protein n=1 Tax=Gymnopus androsaceus JB14 TaxID=1447944 RepID=A0A6A4I2Y6_9AGAR|nr:hypothetical protein BT96DRAFT_357444 [Gymnopus androsaceus JB14]
MCDLAEKTPLTIFHHTLPPLNTYVPPTTPSSAINLPKRQSAFQSALDQLSKLKLTTPKRNASAFQSMSTVIRTPPSPTVGKSRGSRGLTSSFSSRSILAIKAKSKHDSHIQIVQKGMSSAY